ncbi:putative RNA-directed DNA polymerase, eukaryota, reverse transcriptase zinc-binding domain protein [Tanacetum coccineum]
MAQVSIVKRASMIVVVAMALSAAVSSVSAQAQAPAPSPDSYWELPKEDVRNAVRCVFDSFVMPRGVNSSFIMLIPKISNPIHFKDFRPIWLIGMQCKIIAKILANRLSKVIDKVVYQEQSTFIAGRQILDGPIVLSELMSWYKKKKKKKLMLFKVDFEKAFDTVSWKYLDHMLLSLGFGSKWRRWIQVCLHSATSSILVNGSPFSEFSIKCGLRQGDPLSPFQFINVMEGLHIAMQNAVFYLALGLKINASKANVFGLGVSSQDVKDMASDTGCSSGNIPFSYLGLPLEANMHLTANWQPLIDRWRWRYVNSSDSLWARVVKVIHGVETVFDLKGCSCNGVWSSIISSYAKLHDQNIIPVNTLCLNVGDGSSVRFWKDNWNDNGPLMLRFIWLYHLDVNKDCLLLDRRVYDAWVIHFKKGIAKYAKVSSTPQKCLDLDSSYFIQEIILL